MNKSRVITIGTAAAALALTAGTASAATLITSHDIKDHTIHRVDLADGINRSLSMARQPGTAGTVYRIAHYATAGSGAIATVSCADTEKQSQKYVAVAGGVQMINADGDTNVNDDANPVISDSFPGRMNWTGDSASPKENRLDGWIVRFGTQQMNTPVNIWAICMRRSSDVKVETNNY